MDRIPQAKAGAPLWLLLAFMMSVAGLLLVFQLLPVLVRELVVAEGE